MLVAVCLSCEKTQRLPIKMGLGSFGTLGQISNQGALDEVFERQDGRDDFIGQGSWLENRNELPEEPDEECPSSNATRL